MSEFEKSSFQNLKFKSSSQSEINEAISLLGKLGYEVHGYFSVGDALKHWGLCAWDDGEITEGYLESKDFKEITLSDLKGITTDKSNSDTFILERLLGCEVKIKYSGVTGYVTDVIDNGYAFHICCGSSFDVVSKYHLTFFTEDGDKLTFNEYVKLYYPKG